MAGPVFVLELIEAELTQNSINITNNNCDSNSSPLFSCIESLYNMQKYPIEFSSEFICIFLDKNTNSHKIFRFDISLENSFWRIANIVDSNNYHCEIIGSGKIIGERRLFPHGPSFDLENTFNNLMNQYGNISQASMALKAEVETRFDILKQKLNINIHEELGISPLFYRSEVEEDHFALILDEVDSVAFVNCKMKPSGYTMSPSSSGGIEFFDKISDEVVVAYQTKQANYNNIISQSTIDPDGREIV